MTNPLSELPVPLLQAPMAGGPSTAALAVANELGVGHDEIRRALAGFGGVKRRFTKTGEWNGVTVIDDYGHHPVEIAAVLKAARESTNGRIVAVVQPHRYTRLSHLFNEFCTCFENADSVLVADVYSAGEEPIDHFQKSILREEIAAANGDKIFAMTEFMLAPFGMIDNYTLARWLFIGLNTAAIIAALSVHSFKGGATRRAPCRAAVSSSAARMPLNSRLASSATSHLLIAIISARLAAIPMIQSFFGRTIAT